MEADEPGLWALYTTLGSNSILVVSRLVRDGQLLRVTHTWETHVFKKAVSNVFMARSVLYATRYVDDNHQVFYAFNTDTHWLCHWRSWQREWPA